MNKKTKIWLGIILVIILIGIVGAGGKMYLDKRAEEKKEALIEIVKEHKDLIEKDLNTYDKNHHIQSITIRYDTVELNPMGGIMVDGYINGDKTLTFGGMLIEENSGKFSSAGTDVSAKLDDFLTEK